MTELERRALMGDRQAQKECTKEGIVLPCPLCAGKLEELITGNVFKCHKCGCVFNFPPNSKDFGLYEFLEKINTRPTLSIGKCGECVNKYSSEFCECREDDDFCINFEPRGYTKNT